MANILVTGATGFVGTKLCAVLRREGHVLSGTTRDSNTRAGPENIPLNLVGEIGPETDWSRALVGAEIVVHLAARVHVMREESGTPLDAFRRTNRDGTRSLAAQSARAGVRRMIFVSTVKVHGEESRERAFHESDPPAPKDAYSVSKWEAEQAITDVAAETGLEFVILRPPLVYGPGVKGNFLDLLRACARGRPLPLGKIENRRSLINVMNLAEAIAGCVTHPGIIGETFLLRDDESLSTPELVGRTADALGAHIRLLKIPIWALRAAGMMAGRRSAIDRLTESLVVDDSKIRRMVGWSPTITVDRGLAETADWFLKNQIQLL